MLSDEEKKALDVIKSLEISIYNGKSQIIPGDTTKEISTAIYTTINLIEKQSKEIEELKEKNKQVKFLYDDACKCLLNTVDKDKIKAKIEEVKDGTFDAKIVLQSLLEKE